jgi:tRNA-splicing ligase RtcB
MKRVIHKEGVPVKMWLDDIEHGALEQALHLAQLPFIHKHVAIMPDAHQGYGMPIGGVIALDGVVIPNAVGVDIGCGMCAARTNILGMEKSTMRIVMDKIRRAIPVGFKHHKEMVPTGFVPPLETTKFPGLSPYPIVHQEYNSARRQVGTLGGGNHFIELQHDTDSLWVMIHSGSRNVGKKVADHWNKVAIALNKKWACSIPKGWQLAFLPVDSKEGQSYLQEMQWCVDFAYRNRKRMMHIVLDIIAKETGGGDIMEAFYNIAHNYAVEEEHYGKKVIVHRKGATKASEGTIGIIPGSQGTKSYIVKGLGNKESFESCSHGAGRTMSRSKARDVLSLEEEQAKLDEQGIIHGLRGRKALDEAPGAYKDISVVMKNQEDLVKIRTELTPLAVIKG